MRYINLFHFKMTSNGKKMKVDTKVASYMGIGPEKALYIFYWREKVEKL